MELPRCPRPTQPGLYIVQRVKYRDRPALAEIRAERGALLFLCEISMFPLARLEPDAIFWGPVTLSVDPKLPPT